MTTEANEITPEIQQLIDEAVGKEVAGLKAKNAELIADKKELKGQIENLTKQFDGLDIEAVKAFMTKAGQDEETRLIAEGKIDEVVEKRTERLRAEHERQLKAERDRADAAERASASLKERALADAIRSAASKAGALAEATDDFVFRSRGQFAFNESGDVVAVDRDGEVIYGKDGKTPMSPLEWAESLKETAPHLWPRAAGAGAPGNNGGKATKTFSDMTEAERTALYRENPEKYRQMREAATKE